MSNFFQYFPRTTYKFGDETTDDVIQNLAIYADIVDQVKDERSTYMDYNIVENERPDQVSFKLYRTPNYHWTFYLLNDKLREQGWPVTRAAVLAKAKKDYPNTVLNTRSNLGAVKGFFKTGDRIAGRSSGASADIIHRRLDFGQLIVSNITNGPFTAGELLEVQGTNDVITLETSVSEFNAAHHFEDGNKFITDLGFDSANAAVPGQLLSGSLLTEVTFLERLHNQNDNLKQIRVFKPDTIKLVVDAFREAVAS